ncbi:hypothetical protein [Heyndrickxia sporothermodurans]|uniref:Uncharacterized protein n=1 Tax=Heyndrickxia sporothermodurans TaxID=46224 RepID=A0A150LCZ7_9BACI|nr:hypothetical protein [Heyndrickxia sporothermodurans]KYD10207.1 hypothetical protein B4102_0391 [Heyndrickxia sporothermodurans]
MYIIKLIEAYLPFIGFGFSFSVFIIAFSASMINKKKTKNQN